MSSLNKLYSKIKLFPRLGRRSVFLLATPLLLPLVLLHSSPSSAPTSSSQSKTASLPPQPSSEVPGEPPAAESNSVTSPEPSVTATTPKSSATAAKPAATKQKSHSKPQYTAPAVEIRVAIAKDIPAVTIGTSTTANILDANSNKSLRKLTPKQGFAAQASGVNLLLGDWQLPSAVVIKPSQGGYVYVGDRWYRGKVLLVSEGNNLLAVNYVDLEHYLYSVVGSEMHPNAPIEALKAQAIAARSYALVHLFRPANRLYSLGATERWQVYKGVGSEWNTTHQAVNQTSGQILSDEGGIFESLYAASDEIVARAHGGAGMSQTGAYELAAQGYNYQQILGNYYPSTRLARLELKRGQGSRS